MHGQWPGLSTVIKGKAGPYSSVICNLGLPDLCVLDSDSAMGWWEREWKEYYITAGRGY